MGAATALYALLVFQAAGWFLASGMMQFQAKKVAHVAMNLPETPFCTVTIPVELLSKIRVGKKEIRLDGKLYDIKNQTVQGDSVTLRLYHDRHEEAILDALSGLILPGEGPNAALPLQNWLVRWLGSAFLPPTLTVLNWTPIVFSTHSFACLLPAAQNTPGCFSPPPELK